MNRDDMLMHLLVIHNRNSKIRIIALDEMQNGRE
jgi:hypothetical protein